RLGDAFLGQQQDLMDAVQRLRAPAQAQGTLATTAQQTVVVEQAPQPIIQIVPVNPQVIYVPVYNPIVVYGPWPYPAYPPYYYYPVGWPVGGAFFSFGPGIFVGLGLWGIFDWHRHHVVIDAPRYRRFTEVVNVEARRDEPERSESRRVDPGRSQPGRTDQERGQPDWAARVPQGRVQPPAEQPRPSVQAPARPEPGRAQPGSVPRVETAPPSPGQLPGHLPGQRREPGMFEGIGN